MYNAPYYPGAAEPPIPSNPKLIRCKFIENLADYGGGIYNDNSSPVLNCCGFFANQGNSGGGMFNYRGSIILTSCIFNGNLATLGGGVLINGSNATLTNCTFKSNSGSQLGGGIHNVEAATTLTNCILWANRAGNRTDESAQIDGGTPNINYCCVQSWTGMWNGMGNICKNPLFVDCDGDDNIVGNEDDNLRLLQNSPCIDTGDNNAVPPDVNDYEGNPRIVNDTVDMGAFESSKASGMEVIYVDKDAEGANDGSSWPDAVPDLQNALQIVALRPNVREIRVAQGVYTPAEPNAEPDATFQLINGVTIKGGYAGFGEPDPNAWNPEVYVTILSGDFNGDDADVNDPYDLWNDPNRDENCYHVVTAIGTDETAVLDGFTITGGNANGDGGGIYIMLGNPTIIRCTLRANAAIGDGGGIYLLFSDPNTNIQECTISENAAYNGGGIYCFASSATLTENIIVTNRADGFGSGICCYKYSNPKILRNFIAYNTAQDGGGIYCEQSDPNIMNNIIVKNTATDDGGGIACINEPAPLICNNTIVQNKANPQGGGIYCQDTNPVIKNCIIWGNGDDLHNYARYALVCEPNITYSCVEDGHEGLGNISRAPYFVNPDNNDYRLQPWSPCIDEGDPNSDYSFEPLPNGDRIDMGAYGNTPEATTKGQDRDGNQMLGDGMPDEWEMEHFGNTSAQPWENPDGDDLTNIEEYQAGTNPHIAYEGLMETVYVRANANDPQDGTLSHPFATIQQGIDAVIDGGRILVTGDSVGIFNERLIIDEKVLYIQGGYDFNFKAIRGYTTLSGERQGRPIVYVNVRGGFLCEFIIRDGYERDGGGIYFLNSSPTITDCNITENESKDDGGAIYCFNSAPRIQYCTITRNYIGDGGAIYLRYSAPIFRQCTITGNQADVGGGIYMRKSTPQIINCTITQNIARSKGGGIYCRQGSAPVVSNCIISDNTSVSNGGSIESFEESSLTISNCVIKGNKPNGVRQDSNTVNINGVVDIISNDWVLRDVTLNGNGQLRTTSDVLLKMDNCSISCNLAGTGTVYVEPASELIICGNAQVNLDNATDPSKNGTIQCDGLLRVKNKAKICNANINVTRAHFEGDIEVTKSVITAEAEAPYGQFFIEDTVEIRDNDIHADGDRYMDLDPSLFAGLIANNKIFVTITEGVGRTRGGLLELRGRPGLAVGVSPDPNNPFFCQAENIPGFDPKSWTIDTLELKPGAKLNLTNRFDFQAPFDMNGENEVLYVRKLILGKGAILNTAFNHIYYQNLPDPSWVVKNEPLLGFSLNNIALDNNNEFIIRIKHNNFTRPENSGYNRTHVERVTGQQPDPKGMMRMCNLIDQDPQSPSYQQVINARAKGLFAKSIEDKILIRFEYLFETYEPGTKLLVYLTDSPELLDDSNRVGRYILVGQLPAPPPGRPGSVGSGRFGTFHKYAYKGNLDFIRGTRVELELIGPAGCCVLINNFDPQIHCSTQVCWDVDGETGVNVLDFLTVNYHVGCSAVFRHDANNSLECLDSDLSYDGSIDLVDVEAWAIGLSMPDDVDLCTVPLVPGVSGIYGLPSLESSVSFLDAILISGKRGTSDDDEKLEDCLYILDGEAKYINKITRQFNRTNGRLIKDFGGEIYQVNHINGLVRLSDGKAVVPPGSVDYLNFKVFIGLGVEGDGIKNLFGRPILDAVFDADGYVYVVPVVVSPPGPDPPYEAAAKLQLLEAETPPYYKIVQLYYDPPPETDKDFRNNLREIEIDNKGNLYVANVNINANDILWVYNKDTAELQDYLELDTLYNKRFAPFAMHISNSEGMLYLASSLQEEEDSEANSVLLYAFSTESLMPASPIKINGMGHITDIAEEPATGTLWVVGFTMAELPDKITKDTRPFYKPYLAKVPPGATGPVDANCLYDPVKYPDNDLALPVSILWTQSCDKADMNNSKKVNFADFALLANYWIKPSCPTGSNCAIGDLNGDGAVDISDLAAFSHCWLVQNP
jgi:parallel beta-helix repeat protein